MAVEFHKTELKKERLEDCFRIDDSYIFIETLQNIVYEHFGYIDPDLLPRYAKMIELLSEFDVKAGNAGFYHYLFTPSGDFAGDVRDYLEVIHAQATLEIMNQVASYFPNAIIPDAEDDRQDIIEDLEAFNAEFDQFADADRKYLKLEENIIELLRDYLKDKIEDIVNEYNKWLHEHK
ncbi:hypothetical protein DENIS_1832 [Desulfonema ishimotonii]|uniref:DNA mimic protein DMP19 C-terminal domain-containing protein n=1 Tax=Desulfonema ishimotonii TaxID=45657 RepID=A0A401FV92_9BACT|nr:DUF4375 domain-containing protein [Desulfonema ishimotonii]GBC60873.1 hypothetical protein DENIS_1832 [Desulfonema ishimotonii]